MSRLASRSPAAPFQISRPAPVTPQRPPQSTNTTEAQTLRHMVQEREEEIDRLRYALQKIKDLPPVDEIHAIAADALDGGGDDHAG